MILRTTNRGHAMIRSARRAERPASAVRGSRYVQQHCLGSINLNTDRAWKRYGEVDPYFGVITHKDYHAWALTDEKRENFFRSGEEHVEKVMKILREINPGFSPARTIDFGCGVGRLTLPLARVSTSVIGVDVAPGMLSEAQKNAAERGVSNVEFAHEISGHFDFIHSYIVLQHIPPRRGLPIVRDLVSRVERGGMIALQVPYHAAPWVKLAIRVKHVNPIIKRTFNLVNGRPWNFPALTMYCYSVPSILAILRDAGIDDIRIVLDSAAGPYYSSMILCGWSGQG
jgi:2-polyprenyl-3-methyl-5-hydroxy-6-metoxy-1,4-benzoquinol methylase